MYVIHCKDNLYYPISLIFSEKNTNTLFPVLIVGGLEYS